MSATETPTKPPGGEIDDYPFLEAINEALELAVHYAQAARHADTDFRLSMNLKMASRAVRCALEIYGDRLRGYPKEETK